MKNTLSVTIGLFILLLAGCLQMETKVKIDKNGAGTIEQVIVMRADMLAMLNSMQPDPAKKEAGLMDEKKLRAGAAKMGKGVRFVSANPIKNKVGEGYKVIYAFDDINAVKVSQTPNDALPQADGGQSKSGDQEFVTFQFKKGNPANLTINLYRKDEVEKSKKPEKEAEGEKPEKPEQMDPAMLEQFYRDMKLSMTVEPVGTIVDSTADFKTASSIILMDMDFNELLKSKEALDTLMKGKVDTLEDMKAFSQKYPGIKMETKEKIQVRFR